MQPTRTWLTILLALLACLLWAPGCLLPPHLTWLSTSFLATEHGFTSGRHIQIPSIYMDKGRGTRDYFCFYLHARKGYHADMDRGAGVRSIKGAIHMLLGDYTLDNLEVQTTVNRFTFHSQWYIDA